MSTIFDSDLSKLEGLEGLSDYLSNSAEALHIVSGDATIMWANKTELEFLGYKENEYISKPITQFHVDQEVIGDILTRLLAGEILKNHPARLIAADGSHKQVLINSSGYWKDGKFSHTRCFSRDVSDVIDLSDLITKNKESILNLATA